MSPATPAAPPTLPLIFAELGLGEMFTFEHDAETVAYRKTGQREYELAVPVVKRVGTCTAPVARIEQSSTGSAPPSETMLNLLAIKERLQTVCYGYRWTDVLTLCDEIERLRQASPAGPATPTPEGPPLTIVGLNEFQQIGWALSHGSERDKHDTLIRVERRLRDTVAIYHTEREMHAAWRKRAEEAEASGPAVRPQPEPPIISDRELQIRESVRVEWRLKAEQGIHHDHLSDLAFLFVELDMLRKSAASQPPAVPEQQQGKSVHYHEHCPEVLGTGKCDCQQRHEEDQWDATNPKS